MKRTTELIAEPGDRVIVGAFSKEANAVVLWAETRWSRDAAYNFYLVAFLGTDEPSSRR